MDKFSKILLLLVVGQATMTMAEDEVSDDSQRKGLFLFNVVTFKNTECTSTSALGTSARNGTCYTSSECSSRGGTTFGTCASGFGVCCVFLVSTTGSNIVQNCTYVRNPGFPTSYTQTSAVSYTVQKSQSDVCFLRLDFVSFTTQGPLLTTEVNGGLCVDSFQITATSGNLIPNFCGLNTGQHVYVDIGNLATSTATLAFTFGNNNNARNWEIKVTQLECWNSARPPNGCMQYYTDLTGRLTTFNYLNTASTHLANQLYSICVRQEQGYCCIQYNACVENQGYSLDVSKLAMAVLDTACTGDFLGINGGSASCNVGVGPNDLHTRFCGSILSTDSVNAAAVNIPICDCTRPFEIVVRTDAGIDLAAGNGAISRGACLEYKQLPC